MKNPDFAKFYGGLMPSWKTLKTCGHVGSGITAFTSVYLISQSSLSHLMQIGVSILSVLVTFFVILTIEGGISRFAPYWARAIVRKKFANRFFIGMFAGVTLVMIPLIVASPILSGQGGKLGFERLAGEEHQTNTDPVESKYQIQYDSLANTYGLEESEIRAGFQSQITAVHASYQARIREQWGVYNHNKGLLRNGHDWAQGHMNKASKKVKQLEAEREAQKAEVLAQQTIALNAFYDRRESALQNIINARDRKLSIIDQADSRRIGKHDQFKGQWGNYALFFGVFCSFLTLISVFMIEAYHAGAGHEVSEFVYAPKESKIQHAMGAISKWFDDLYWTAIGRIQKQPKMAPKSTAYTNRQIGFFNAENNPNVSAKSLETKDFQAESTPKVSGTHSGEFDVQFSLLQTEKLITDLRNHYRRSKQASLKVTRDDNARKYQEKKTHAESLGIMVRETSPTSLSISFRTEE